MLPGLPRGLTATLQVKVWDFSQFPTYEDAVGIGTTGASVPFTYRVPPSFTLPTDYYMEGLQAFALVPEPSVLALGLIGVVSLLLLAKSRRKP